MEPARAVSLQIYEEPGLKRELRVFVEYDRRGVYITDGAVPSYVFERIWRRIQMHVHKALLTEDNSVQTKEER